MACLENTWIILVQEAGKKKLFTNNVSEILICFQPTCSLFCSCWFGRAGCSIKTFFILNNRIRLTSARRG